MAIEQPPPFIPAEMQGVIQGLEHDLPTEPLLLYRSVSADGGQISYPEPRLLQPNQLAKSENLKTWRHGRRERMPGTYIVDSSGADTDGGNGLAWFDDGTYRFSFAHWGADLFRTVDGAGVWTNSATILDRVSMAVQGNSNTSSTDYPSLYYVYPEAPTAMHVLQHRGSGTSWTVIADGTSGLSPRCAMWWQNRLWIGAGAAIYYSPDNGIVTDGGSPWNFLNTGIVVDDNISDQVMALVPARGLEPFMLVFLRHRIYVYRVTISGGGLDFNTSYLKPITYEVGCIATRSPATVGPMVFFLAGDGVRAVVRAEDDALAGVREPISKPIQDIIDDINWTYADEAVGMAFENRYYLSIPTGASTVCNTVIVYDLATNSWSVWPGSNSHGWAGAAKIFTGGRDRLSFMSATSETYNAVAANHVFYYDEDRDQDGSNVPASAQDIETEENSPGITFGYPENLKEWRWVELEYYNPSATQATLTVTAKIDGAAAVSVGSLATASDTARTRIKWSLEGLATGREIQLIIKETGAGTMKVFGYTIAANVKPLEDD